MKSTGGSPEDEFYGIISVMEEMRANPDIPHNYLVEIEKAHEILLRNATECREVALQAYDYGRLVGAYQTGGDEEVLADSDRRLLRRRQSNSGKASGAKRRKGRWQKHAQDLAVKARQRKPTLSQERVAAEL